MKNLFVCSIIYVFSNCLFSQTLQSYSGSFLDDNNFEGIATYTYYEKDYAKIKHGNFKFSFSSNGVDRELKGEFIDGKRNGIWSSTMSGRGVSTLVHGAFINGIPNGKFTYTAKYNGELYQIMNVEFNKGLLIGDFLFENKKLNIKVIGQLTNSGYMDGEWKIIKNNKEQIQKYVDSVFVLYIERNVNDGVVLKVEDYVLPKNINKEDVLIKNREWNLYDENKLYGEYFQKYLWANWDLKSVGGIASNALNGMFYLDESQKKTLSYHNLLGLNFYNQIDFNKKDNINFVFRDINNNLDRVNSEINAFNANKNLVLSNELKIRDSIVNLLIKVNSFKGNYDNIIKLNSSLLKAVNLCKDLINKTSVNINNIKSLSFMTKDFKGLTDPFVSKMDELDKINQKILDFDFKVNNQSALGLVENYKSHSIESKNLSIELIKFDSISNFKSVYEKTESLKSDLSNEIDKTNNLSQKVILSKKGDFLNEKNQIVYSFYHSNLKQDYSLLEISEFLLKLKLVNEKISKIIESDDTIKNVVKEIKDLDNKIDPVSIEKILVK